MGRSDFEKDIQRKLREREIVPSEKAWKKLNSQLPKEKAKKGVTWYWVAAAVIILISAGVFMNNDKNELEKPAVVNTGKESEKTIQQTPSPKIKEDVIVNEIQDPLRKTEENKIIPEISNSVVVAQEIEKEIEIPEEPEVVTIEDKKVTEVVSYLEALQSSGKEITEAMVDSLLIQAQRELALERTFKDSTGKVDAMALLNEVEEELDKSFKDKLFKALEGGFIVIKTAVADRN